MSDGSIGWERLRRLRAVFLDGAADAADYWSDTALLDDYDRTFGARIRWKWEFVLDELAQLGWRAPAGLVLDWGCGTGVASRALRCLDAPVTPQLAARYHRLVGLSEFVARDEERARLAFAAARAADPLGALPTTVLPQGHTARALSESASTPGRTRPLAVRRREQLYVDGVLATARPVDRDALVQVQVGSEIVLNADLKPGDRLPYGVRSQAARRAWVAVAAGLGVAGAAAATLWLVPS